MFQMMLVLAVSAPNLAPPVAPPPRAAAPKLSVTSENGQVELRWESSGTSYVAVGSKAVFGNGVLTITGDSSGVKLSVSFRSRLGTQKTLSRITQLEIALSDCTPTLRELPLPPPQTKFVQPN